jgi:hypothetical protein
MIEQIFIVVLFVKHYIFKHLSNISFCMCSQHNAFQVKMTLCQITIERTLCFFNFLKFCVLIDLEKSVVMSFIFRGVRCRICVIWSSYSHSK